MVQSIYTNVDIYKPEIWAMESLQILFENIGLRGKVKVDFSNEIREKGDTINTRFPDIMVAKSVGSTGEVVSVSEPQATNIQVILDQNQDVSFYLRDRDSSLALKNLREEFMIPAVLGLIRAIEDDGISKMSSIANGFGDLTDSNVIQIVSTASGVDNNTPGAFDILVIAEAAKELNVKKVPLTDRHMIIHPQQQYDMLTDSSNTNLLLLKANEATDTKALREGEIGRLFGFEVSMQQGILTAADSSASAFPNAEAVQALFFHRNSTAYVNRMMDSPPSNFGVASTVRSFMDQALRVQGWYEGMAKRTVFSLDALWGWKVMRQDMGGSIYSRASA